MVDLLKKIQMKKQQMKLERAKEEESKSKLNEDKTIPEIKDKSKSKRKTIEKKIKEPEAKPSEEQVKNADSLEGVIANLFQQNQIKETSPNEKAALLAKVDTMNQSEIKILIKGLKNKIDMMKETRKQNMNTKMKIIEKTQKKLENKNNSELLKKDDELLKEQMRSQIMSKSNQQSMNLLSMNMMLANQFNTIPNGTLPHLLGLTLPQITYPLLTSQAVLPSSPEVKIEQKDDVLKIEEN